MKLSATKLLKDLLKLETLDEQVKKINELSKSVISRQPELKKALSVHNDINSDLYSWTPEQITLATQSYTSALKNREVTSKSSVKSLIGYVSNLQKLGNPNKSIGEIAQEYADKRIEDFIDKSVNLIAGDEEQLAYLDKLIGILKDKDLVLGFTRSKYFIGNYEYASEGMMMFENTYGISLPVAKLELYLESKGIKVKSTYRDIKNYSDDFTIKGTRQKQQVYEDEKNYKN